MLDSHQFQNLLLQSKSRINKEENQLTLQQLKIKKDNQINSAQRKHPLQQIELEYYDKQLKTAYHLSFTNIQLIILLNHDFPTSYPQIFSTQYLIHQLIDSTTLEIKYKKKKELCQILDDLKEEFTKNPPQLDALIEEMKNNQQEGIFLQSIQNLNKVDLRNLFPGVSPNQFKELVEGEKLGEYVLQLDDSRKVAQIFVESSQQNQSLGTSILDIQRQNEEIKQQIQQKSERFIDVINNANSAHMQCETIKKIHDDKELLRVLDQKISNLETKSADLYENFQEEEINPKLFQNSIKAFLEIRKQFQLCKIKKKHFVAQLQVQVKKN